MTDFLIVVINGPPESGKDTLAMKLVSESHPYMMLGGRKVMFWQEKMSLPLKDAIAAFFGLTSYDIELRKDSKCLPNGVTIREAIIALDKQWVRPLFGDTCLGELMVKSLKLRKMEKFQDATHVFIVDAGVNAEVEMLRIAFGRYLKVIHLYREGKSFTDSRSYVDQCDMNLYNDDHISVVANRICLAVHRWLDDNEYARITAGVSKAGTIDQPE